MSDPLFIDIHCHPALKPFARSYPSNKNSKKPKKRKSIWHQIKPNNLTEIINEYATTTHFTQSDFTTLLEGKVRVIFASLSPLEKGFFISKLGTGPITDLLTQWATGIGFRKINFIQDHKNYYSELELEMDFYKQLHNKEINVDGEKKKYRIVRNYSEIMQNLAESEDIISVVICIEGGHVFNEDCTVEPTEDKILENLEAVLAWKYKPLFISPAHHFWNHICGHAFSLTDLIKRFLNQEDHANTKITGLGDKLIRKLMDNGVLIDIKHMSRKSRRDFYSMLEEDAYKNIPIVVSHGNVNGHSTVYTDINHGTENGLFYGADINFYDDEIVKVAKSKGLFGIQLDERRIASKKELDKIEHSMPVETKMEVFSSLLWNQMMHIARTVDAVNEPAWDCMCIGSDYDGVVDPMDGFWTSAEYKLLYDHLLLHVRNFMNTTPNSFNREDSNIPAEDIVEKLFSKNVMVFLSANFI